MAHMLLRTGLSVLALSIASAPAFAQTIIGPADVGRVQEQAKKVPNLQVPTPKVEVKQAPSANAPAGAEKMMLTFTGVEMQGMTAYAMPEIESVYADKIGQKISLAEVYGIANALTAKYRNDGFILSQVLVPPQTIDGGKVKLQVIEGYVDQVTIEGAANERERELIASYADRARLSVPMNVSDLEQAILVINDLAGVSARSILSPSATKTGAADLRIVLDHKLYDGAVSLDNYGSRYLGQYEATAAIAFNSLLGLSERIGGQVVYAPGRDLDKELMYTDLSYSMPVGSWGTKIDLLASYSSTDPGHTLKEFDINGRSVYLSAKVSQPIIRTRELNWGLYALLDGRNVDTDSNIEETRVDNIRALRVGSELDFMDTMLGAAYNTLNVELSKGVNILGASEAGDANLSRASGDPEFSKVEIEFQRLQRLTNKANLLVGIKGQKATDALLSSEEFGVGGPGYGRGYDPSEIVGDHGIAAKAELQYNNPWQWGLVDSYQFYGFVDGGRVWNIDATTSADKKISLASTGLGMRATFPAQTQAGFYVALPLNRDVESMGSQSARFYFNLAQPF